MEKEFDRLTESSRPDVPDPSEFRRLNRAGLRDPIERTNRTADRKRILVAVTACLALMVLLSGRLNKLGTYDASSERRGTDLGDGSATVHVPVMGSHRLTVTEDFDEAQIRQVGTSITPGSGRETEEVDFDAVLCVNDQVACMAAGRLEERGLRVPEEIQVFGFGNSDIGRFFTPRISTTCPDMPQMCQRIKNIIHRHHEGKPVETRQYVSIPKVVRRGSTRPIA